MANNNTNIIRDYQVHDRKYTANLTYLDLVCKEEELKQMRGTRDRFTAVYGALRKLEGMPKTTEAENAARLAKAQEINNELGDLNTVGIGLGRSVNYQSIMGKIIFKILAIFSKVWPFCSKF